MSRKGPCDDIFSAGEHFDCKRTSLNFLDQFHWTVPTAIAVHLSPCYLYICNTHRSFFAFIIEAPAIAFYRKISDILRKRCRVPFYLQMVVTGSIGLALILTGATVMWRLLSSWFGRLEKESRFRISDLTLEDPSSPAKIPTPSLFSEASKTLSIVIPAFNEEDRLPSTLEETLAYLQRRRDRQGPNFTYEVIVVDDGSRDRTVAAAFKFVKRHGFDAVRVLRLPANRGKGYAVKAGMMCCRGQDLLFMDADGATRVSDVERLESKLDEITSTSTDTTSAGGDDVKTENRKPLNHTAKSNKNTRLGFVLGSRAHLQESAMAQRTWIRNILMHGFHALVTLVVGNAIRDTQCGFKLMTRPAAQLIIPNQRLQRWAFDVELVYLAQVLKVPMAEVQVAWTEIPGSKVRITSIVHIAFELAMVRFGYGTGVWTVAGPQELGKLN